MIYKFNFLTPLTAAFLAPILFGVSIPFAKYFVGILSSLLLAGLLYLGAGIGLTVIFLIKNRRGYRLSFFDKEWLWLAGVIIFGGILGPILLMFALTQISSSSASLLLNLSPVFTTIFACLFFKEHATYKVIAGMILIVAGSVALTWTNEEVIQQNQLGLFAIIGACICWAIDNNLTKKLISLDVFFIAGTKGLVAGIINTSLGFILEDSLIKLTDIGIVLLLGFFGYGISLVCFILALHKLGTIKTISYFSLAPFFGALVSILLFSEENISLFWVATLLMGCGVWLQLNENYRHNREGLTL